MSGPPDRHRSTPVELKERLEAERTGEPFLLLRDSTGAQRLVSLGESGGPLSLGRDSGTDIELPWDDQVSRLHAVLERVGTAWTVADGGLSRNGTFVNGERLTARRRLRPGDVLTLGETDLSYHEPASTEVRETVLAIEVSAQAELSKMQRKVLVELCRPVRERDAYAPPATNREIAAALHLSEAAIKSHLRTLFAKFQVSDLAQNRKRAALAEAAIRSGELSDRDFLG